MGEVEIADEEVVELDGAGEIEAIALISLEMRTVADMKIMTATHGGHLFPMNLLHLLMVEVVVRTRHAACIIAVMRIIRDVPNSHQLHTSLLYLLTLGVIVPIRHGTTAIADMGTIRIICSNHPFPLIQLQPLMATVIRTPRFHPQGISRTHRNPSRFRPRKWPCRFRRCTHRCPMAGASHGPRWTSLLPGRPASRAPCPLQPPVPPDHCLEEHTSTRHSSGIRSLHR